jgi:hypothetical protein
MNSVEQIFSWKYALIKIFHKVDFFSNDSFTLSSRSFKKKYNDDETFFTEFTTTNKTKSDDTIDPINFKKILFSNTSLVIYYV